MKKSARPLTYDELLFKASAYCASAEHCVSEVSEKLHQWGASTTDAECIVDYLQQENYLNEQRFCEAFVRDKFRFNHWGRIKISVMLRAKSVASESIDNALALISDEDYVAALTDLLQSKLRSLKYTDDYDRTAKLARFAQSRGFETGLIFDVIAKL